MQLKMKIGERHMCFFKSRWLQRQIVCAIMMVALAQTGASTVSAADLLDPSFQPGTGPNAEVLDVAVDGSGRIVIVGYFTSYNGVARNYIARLNPDGSLDRSFAASLTIGKNQGSGRGQALAVQLDGRILVGGNFSKVNGYASQNIARLNPDGSLDRSFAASVGGGGVIGSISVLGDQKIFITGAFTTVNGVAQRGYARLMPDGSLDPGFVQTNGASDSVSRVALLPSGRVLLGGYFQAINGEACNYLARLNSDGTLDNTFHMQMPVEIGPISALALQPCGSDLSSDESFKILLNGFNAEQVLPIVRLWPDGTFDTYLAENVLAYVNRMNVGADGSILAIGTALGSSSLCSVLLLTAEGFSVPTFWPARACAIANINSMAVSEAGIVIAGNFGRINGNPCPRIARFGNEALPESYAAIHLGMPQVVSVRSGSGWAASVTLPVRDASGAPVQGVQIYGRWSVWGGSAKGFPINVSLQTDAIGQCVFSQVFGRSCYQADFTLTGVGPFAATGTYYDPLFDEIHIPSGPFGNDDRVSVIAP